MHGEDPIQLIDSAHGALSICRSGHGLACSLRQLEPPAQSIVGQVRQQTVKHASLVSAC